MNLNLTPPTRGWTRLTPNLGYHYAPGIGVRFSAALGTRISVQYKAHDLRNVYIPPRGSITLRDDAALLPPFEFPNSGGEDFRMGGGQGISPCGDDGTLAQHDSIMRRCAVGLRDMDTGGLLPVSQVQAWGNYDLTRFQYLKAYHFQDGTPRVADGVVPDPMPRPYDGQHLIRAYRIGIRYANDPFVKLDLEDLMHDARLAWPRTRLAAIMDAPPGLGSYEIGREWAWVAYLCTLSRGGSEFGRQMAQVALHVQRPNGLLQRLTYGSFFGSPDPWGNPPHGSGVPTSVEVAQDIEAHMQVVALAKLGQLGAAKRLADAVTSTPKAKWLDCATAAPAGLHPADSFNPWFALASGCYSPVQALNVAKRWRIPNATGGMMGPFPTKPQIVEALRAWGDEGKSRWALRMFG